MGKVVCGVGGVGQQAHTALFEDNGGTDKADCGEEQGDKACSWNQDWQEVCGRQRIQRREEVVPLASGYGCSASGQETLKVDRASDRQGPLLASGTRDR